MILISQNIFVNKSPESCEPYVPPSDDETQIVKVEQQQQEIQSPNELNASAHIDQVDHIVQVDNIGHVDHHIEDRIIENDPEDKGKDSLENIDPIIEKMNFGDQPLPKKDKEAPKIKSFLRISRTQL